MPRVHSPRFVRSGQTLWTALDERFDERDLHGEPNADQVLSFSWPGRRLLSRWANLEAKLHVRVSAINALAAGEDWIAVGSNDGATKLFRADDGSRPAGESTCPGRSPVHCVALTDKEDLVASGTEAGLVRVARIPTGEPLADLTAHGDIVNSVEFSPDDQFVATGSRDGSLRLWQRQGDAFQPLIALPAPGPVAVVHFQSDGKLGMLVQGERAVRIWDVSGLRQRLNQLGLGW
jgi:WD40 repeat protein